MNTEINYGGLSTVPSDYECPDGDLAAAINVIPEDGHIKMLPQPRACLSLRPGEHLLLVHEVPGQTNYILARGDLGKSFDLYWMAKPAAGTNPLPGTSAATHMTIAWGFRDIKPIGNTLVLALDQDLFYFLWKDGGYLFLGERPPFVSIDFGMHNEGTLGETETFEDVPASCVPQQGGLGSGAYIPHRPVGSKEDLAKITQMVYAQLLSALSDNVTGQGFFYQPFFIRYAYRMFDGNYAWHSAPILMLPTVMPPRIIVGDVSSGSDSSVRNVKSTLHVPYFSLYYRVPDRDIDELKRWGDIIAGIDVFITAPVYTYDQSKDFEGGAWINELLFYKRQALPAFSGNISANRGRLSVADSAAQPAEDDGPQSYFLGHYADGLSVYSDHTVAESALSSSKLLWNIQPHERFIENIRSAHDFYKVAEISISDIAGMADLKPLDLTTSDLSNLVTRPTLPDDYQSHFRLLPGTLYAFNSRINMAGMKIQPPRPLPLRSSTAFSNPLHAPVASHYSIRVWSRHNGMRCYATYSASASGDWVPYLTTDCPRYIFYPDAAAYKMEILLNNSIKYVLNLTPHDFLNGAYYFGGFAANIMPENAEEESMQGAVSVYPALSKVYTSEVNNPFYFPVLGINTVGSGEVLGLASAAKALSQGQFGQFPLYAFTTEGVWALETTSTGSYSGRQPITRDVCTNAAAITQIDSAVLFPTARGIMMLSGSDTECITEVINSDTPFDALSLPGMLRLHSVLGHDADTCLPLVPFSQFIASCGIIYDYVHQHIIVFSPQYSYAYVYSLRSRRWGMMHSGIKSTVNSYPEALSVAEDTGGNRLLVDFSTAEGGNISGLVVTRPLHLDAPNILKTVDNVIQRGLFRRGHVKSVLYGSRDLFSWHTVWSSSDHYMRGFSGTPYKWFRIALVLDMMPGESIHGCSVQYRLRHTNQPR